MNECYSGPTKVRMYVRINTNNPKHLTVHEEYRINVRIHPRCLVARSVCSLDRATQPSIGYARYSDYRGGLHRFDSVTDFFGNRTPS